MKNLLTLTVPGGPNGQGVEITPPPHIPSNASSFGKIVGWGIEILLIGSTILALGFLVYGGVMWVSSGGDKTKVEGARKTIIFSIVGLLLCFLSFFLIAIFGAFFNVDLLNLSL